MREHILGELSNIIGRQIREEIPRELERRDFEEVQKSCGLIIDLMTKFFPDNLIFESETGDVENDYSAVLQTLKSDIADRKVDARNANLVFNFLKRLYEDVFLAIPKPTQGK